MGNAKNGMSAVGGWDEFGFDSVFMIELFVGDSHDLMVLWG